jgi:nitrite reductase/ring-hydroxylating ferredoxin subunit
VSTVVAKVGELQPGQTKKFLLDCEGREVSGFLLNFGGALHAYVNRCRHVAMEMDWVENQFFTEDARFVQCATHGALYEPVTGECVAGPPCGRSLYRLPVRVDGDAIVVECPGPLPDD